MNTVSIEEFIDLIGYRPKFVGDELYGSAKYVEFRRRGCCAASMEFAVKRDASSNGQWVYFEAIDFRNYDTSRGETITDDRRRGVVKGYVNRKNAGRMAGAVKASLAAMYRKDGPAW